jgi:hypothetical protein
MGRVRLLEIVRHEGRPEASMKIAVAKEIDPAEPRVAASPDTVKKLKALGADCDPLTKTPHHKNVAIRVTPANAEEIAAMERQLELIPEIA